jgi:hypothetical protein
MPLRLDDLSAAELQAMLSSEVDSLLDEEKYAVEDFVERIGGMENARLAAETLLQLQPDY